MSILELIKRRAIEWRVMDDTDNWYVEIQANGKPFTPCRKPVQSDRKPNGYFYGAFHCEDCALTCVSFGKTKTQAYEFCHGTDDQKFSTFLNSE